MKKVRGPNSNYDANGPKAQQTLKIKKKPGQNGVSTFINIKGHIKISS